MTGEISLSPDEIKGRSRAAQSKWRPYPEYKDSGVEWLGEIPAGWVVETLKRFAPFVSRGNSPDYVDESSIKVINQACIYWDGLRLENVKYQREVDISGWKGLLHQGDLMINSTGTGTLGRAAIFDQNGIFIADGHVTIVRIEPKSMFTKYLYYLIQIPIYQGYIYSAIISGSTNQIELSREGLRSTPIIGPQLDEQHAIAAFLDRETAKIDALIEKKRRLISLFEEKRATIISHAVTKGLDPDVPMKDSGVEWLGDIPAVWDVLRTKFAAKLESGHTPSRQHPEYWVDCNIPWMSLADVWQLRNGRQIYIHETKEQVSKLGIANSSARLLPTKTVILSRTASVGFSGIIACPMATTQDFVNWICGPRLQPEFLLYVFRSMKEEFSRLTMGSTHQTIYMPDVGQFVTPLPPLNEQYEIVGYINKKTAKIDALIFKIHEAIKKLQEYRTALISAAVTGKIDVREASL